MRAHAHTHTKMNKYLSERFTPPFCVCGVLVRKKLSKHRSGREKENYVWAFSPRRVCALFASSEFTLINTIPHAICI